MRISDWSSDVCSSDLGYIIYGEDGAAKGPIAKNLDAARIAQIKETAGLKDGDAVFFACDKEAVAAKLAGQVRNRLGDELDLLEKNTFRFCWIVDRSEEHTSELQSLMRISYAVFCLKKTTH